MKTSTRFAVATHILTILYVHQGKPVSSATLAKSVNTSAAVVRQILMRLSEADLVGSQMGPGGGSLLAKDAKDITLLEIWRATETDQIVCMHRNQPGQQCYVGKHILGVLCEVNEGLQHAMFTKLQSQTLFDIGERVLQEKALDPTPCPS